MSIISDDGPCDEDRAEFAESIADDLTQRINWAEDGLLSLLSTTTETLKGLAIRRRAAAKKD